MFFSKITIEEGSSMFDEQKRRRKYFFSIMHYYFLNIIGDEWYNIFLKVDSNIFIGKRIGRR
jgi:hypothetical protein